MFNSSICSKSSNVRDMTLIPSDLEFNLARSLKVKDHGTKLTPHICCLIKNVKCFIVTFGLTGLIYEI